jgi:hypothetical protein
MGASMEGLRGTLERLSPLVEGQDPRNMAAIRHQLDRALFGGVIEDKFPVLRILDTMTPETANTSHYFWSQAIGPNANGDPTINEQYHNQVLEAFLEDKVLLEIQQSRIDQYGRSESEIDINADKGVLQGRLILDGLIAAETAGAGRGGN